MRIPEKISILIEKYQSGEASEDEKNRLSEWYHSFDDAPSIIQTTSDLTEQQLADRLKQRILETIRDGEKPKLKTIHRIWKLTAAAVIVVFVSAGMVYFFQTGSGKQEHVKITAPINPVLKNDVAPGGNKALLTLSDGTTIVLDSASNGTLSQQGNINVQKLNNGLIAYTVNGQQLTEIEEAFYNTISTPRGGQYRVTLADGTQVWLNAESSIRFPVVFTGSERNVGITGEAYFEVAKNNAMPFRVKAGNSEIEVIGTHFNVNAYDDELFLKTTLLEGSVKVSVPESESGQKGKFLKPGQQAVIPESGKISISDKVDIEEVMAWKNGRFLFKSADLGTILKQIARWYDVDIEYRGNVNLHFTGQLTRNEYVSKVFEKLELTGEVHFKIEGNKIIVTP